MRWVAPISGGCFPIFSLEDKGKAKPDKLHDYIAETGRDPADMGIKSVIFIGEKTPDEWASELAAYKRYNVRHISFNTMGANFTTLETRLDAICCFKEIETEA